MKFEHIRYIDQHEKGTTTITKQIGSRRMYWSFVDELVVDAAVKVLTTMLVKTGQANGDRDDGTQNCPTWMEDARRPWAVVLSTSEKPSSPSPVQDHKVDWFRRSSLQFTGARCWASTEMWQNSNSWVSCFCSGSHARIYIERLRHSWRTFESVIVAHDSGAIWTD